MREKTRLKRLATVEVCTLAMWGSRVIRLTAADTAPQDVAQQVLCFVQSKSVTGITFRPTHMDGI